MQQFLPPKGSQSFTCPCLGLGDMATGACQSDRASTAVEGLP